jgi:hypothetical protein
VIRGDQQRLTQVLVNLLANAASSAADSTITIGAQAAADAGLDFWVDDEGPGPKDPDDTGLFEQFHRSGGEDPEESVGRAARGLAEGMRRAGVPRLVVVGGAGSLEVTPGRRLMDTPGFPPAWKPTALA